jgi:hypothetical protein
MKGWWSLAAAIALVAPGCISGAPPPGAPEAPASASWPIAWIAAPFTGTETKVAVAPSGTLFFTGARADDDAVPDAIVSTLHRSRDGGATWTEVTPRLPTGHVAPPGSVDPILTVDPDTGRVFFASMFPRDVCAFVSWSDTEGDSWSSSPLLCGTHPPFDHPFIVAAKPRLLRPVGYPSIVHVCLNQVGDTQCERSLDGGMTWLPGTPPFAGFDPAADGSLGEGFPQGFCGGLSGAVRAAPDGTLYLPREFCQRPYVAVSRDDGTTWTTQRVSPKSATNGPDPDLAIDAQGNAYYTWIDVAGVAWLTFSKDGGQTWSDGTRVSPEGVTATLPALAVGAPGQAVVGFVGTTGLPRGFLEPDFALDPRPENGTAERAVWDAWIATSGDALSGGAFNATVANGAAPLLRGHCDPRYCPGPFSDYNGAAIGPDGTAYASFVSWCPGRCATPQGSARDVVNGTPGHSFLAALRPWAGRPTT